jgi:hypothetical protein
MQLHPLIAAELTRDHARELAASYARANAPRRRSARLAVWRRSHRAPTTLPPVATPTSAGAC